MPDLYYTTREKADQYDAVIDVFNAIFKELKEMGKKKPEATLSESKIKTINRVLVDARQVLEGAPTYKYLDLLESDDAPQFGDAILVLSQYEGALSTFRARHFGWSGEDHEWIIQKKKSK